MLAFPSMLISAAEKAGMKVPEDVDAYYDPKEYPHFFLFCFWQLGRAIVHGEHWENAKMIAAVPEERLLQVKTVGDAIKLGQELGVYPL